MSQYSMLPRLPRGGSSRKFRTRRAAESHRRLSFEPLEDRQMLAVFTVTNLNDAAVAMAGDAPGTLRQAIFDANSLPGADVIEFDDALSGAVDLSSIDDTEVGPSALLITSEITLRGNANGITLQRDPVAAEMRLFRVAATGSLMLESIMLSGGIARGVSGASGENGGEGRGGAILNQGTLGIIASTLYDNQAIGGNAGAGASGGSGRGGAVYNDNGTLTIRNATLSSNSALGGAGAAAVPAYGGAIYVASGVLTIHNSTITNGSASTGRGVYIISATGAATAEIHSSIITQQEFLITARDFVALEDAGGVLSVSGSRNLIRTHNVSFPDFTIPDPSDPLLAPLANNGGPTLTHNLLTGSQAIDNGNNLLNLPVDQRGPTFSRVVGGTTDIGAVELQTIAPPLPGDYNRDQVVNAADYVVWRKTLNAPVETFAGADGNGNSTIDPPDYTVWTENFGETLPAGSGSGETIEVAVTAAIAADVSQVTSAAVVDATPKSDSSSTARSTAFESLAPTTFRIPTFPWIRGNSARHKDRPLFSGNSPTLTERRHDAALLAVLADRDRVARPESSKGVAESVTNRKSEKDAVVLEGSVQGAKKFLITAKRFHSKAQGRRAAAHPG